MYRKILFVTHEFIFHFAGQPFIVPVYLKEDDYDFWTPDHLAHLFREMRGVVTFQHRFTVLDGDRRNATQEMDMGTFFSSLQMRTDKAEARKLCDFPEQGPGLSLMVPEVLHHFNRLLPYQKYMHETGPMNMVRKFFKLRKFIINMGATYKLVILYRNHKYRWIDTLY